MKLKLSDLWQWTGSIDRLPFILWGLILFAVKYNLDRAVSSVFFNTRWSILNYGDVGEILFRIIPTGTSTAHFYTLLAMSLPFLWAGVVLTLRRLRSAGLPPWLVVLFVVPVVKLFLFVILSFYPSQEERKRQAGETASGFKRRLGLLIPQSRLGSAVLGMSITIPFGLAAVWLGTKVYNDYGWSLFVGLPFCMGFFSVLIYGFHEKRTLGSCLYVASCTMLLAGGALLLVALEGVICIIMAAPIAIVLALAGGAMAYAVQASAWWKPQTPHFFCAGVLLIPAMMNIEHHKAAPAPLLSVKSSVVVNATPETVWKHVVTFSELPEPKEYMFRLGIAYPIRAEIRGHGAGAIRHCVFSTGPFVEPITVWDEPRLLKFSVTANPAPMQEWTPYRAAYPAHLDGFLVSQAGQFHLTRLENGSTLLEGTTWYKHHLWPVRYWQAWSDYIIHTIHLRVLKHVKDLSERDQVVIQQEALRKS